MSALAPRWAFGNRSGCTAVATDCGSQYSAQAYCRYGVMLQITVVYKCTRLGGFQHHLAELKLLAVISQQ